MNIKHIGLIPWPDTINGSFRWAVIRLERQKQLQRSNRGHLVVLIKHSF